MVVALKQILKELIAPNMENQPLCININNNANFEFKSGFIHLLSIFNELIGEDPNTHLKEFHMVCVDMKPHGVDEEQVKVKAFTFPFKRGNKSIFSILPIPSSIGKHFSSIRKDLSNCAFNVLIIK